VPLGIIEDALVKVDEFYFPVDFIILDIDSRSDPSQILIILAQPFLAIAYACINCRTRAMDMSFGIKC